MHQQTQLGLIQEELKIINNYSKLFSDKMDLLIQKFYNNILQTRAGSLFYFTNMEEQYKSFYSAVPMLFSILDCPSALLTEVDSLVLAHSNVILKPEYIDDFTNSLLLAIKQIYSNVLADDIIESYSKIIRIIIDLFKQKLPLITPD